MLVTWWYMSFGSNGNFIFRPYLLYVVLLLRSSTTKDENSNFPWNPQFLAEFKNFTFFPTQLEKLERMELVPRT